MCIKLYLALNIFHRNPNSIVNFAKQINHFDLFLLCTRVINKEVVILIMNFVCFNF
jgi:hypothetical protein